MSPPRSSTLLDRLVAPGAITTLFQPIFEVHKGRARLHALECLSRGPRDTNLARPDVLFLYTRRKRAELQVDRACITAALESARPFYPHDKVELNLSLNVHASTLGRDLDFVDFVISESARCGIPEHRVTVEIVEHTPSWDDPTFFRSLEKLRNSSLRLALDDIGLGYCNYKMLLDCRPDYLKVDRYIIDGCRNDYYRRAVLESITQLAEKFGAWVIAEGLEEEQDLEAVLGLGIDLIQGYILAPPLAQVQLGACRFIDGDRYRLAEIRSQIGPAAVSNSAG